MLDMTENGRFLGPSWWILQLLRVSNIISLLSVAAASLVMVIKTDVKNSFFFFQALSHLITAGIALILIVSELPQPRTIRDFFRNNWPTFSTVDACNRGHSLGWLGVWMVSMGVWVLGSLNGEDVMEKLTLPLWRLTLAAGILAIVFGFFNFIVSVLFRNGAQGITTRMIREHGANVYNARMLMEPSEYDLESATLSGSSHSIRKENKRATAAHRFTQTVTQGFAHNRVTRLFGKGQKPQISAPISAPVVAPSVEPQRPATAADMPVSPASVRSVRSIRSARDSWETSDRASPIAPHVQRPPTALHPVYGKARTYNSSIYSTASHLTRF